MLKKNFRLFRLFGMDVAVHVSVLALVVLIAWRLVTAYFPATVVGLTFATYLSMGGLSALGLLMSVILHEAAHGVMARRCGGAPRDITLFLFGGVAKLDDEPRTPREEFLTAAAGPICSFLIAAVLEAAALFAAPVPAGVLTVLAGLNLALAIFNLLPAFPLDGGRMLRAALWALQDDADEATLVAARLGQGAGVLLSGLGLLGLLQGNPIDGVWQLGLGIFLWLAARRAHTMLRLAQVLRGRPIGDVASPPPVIAPTTPLDEVATLLLRVGGERGLAVTEPDGTLVGFIDDQQLMRIPRHAWPHRRALDIASAVRPTIASSADAWDAARIIARRGGLAVIDDGVLVGSVTLADLHRYTARYALLFGDPAPLGGGSAGSLNALARAARTLSRLRSGRRDPR